MLSQMLKVAAHLTRLRASVIAIKPPEGTKVSYDLNVDIKQVSRSEPGLKLRYAIGIETFPLIYRVEIVGYANVNAEILAKDKRLEEVGQSSLGDIGLEIYRQNFEVLHLVLATMGLDPPSPWLVKDVRLVRQGALG